MTKSIPNARLIRTPPKETRKNVVSAYGRTGFHLLLLPAMVGLQIYAFPEEAIDTLYGTVIIRFLLSVLLLGPAYVANLTYFIPRFLQRGRYVFYLVIIMVSCALTAWAAGQVVGFFPASFTGIADLSSRVSQRISRLVAFSVLIGTAVEMILYWEQQKRQQERVEKEKIQLELSFLKSQINPHFLFNTLNNIHSMAELKSDTTGDAILMLSDLLRYALYGTNKGKVPVQKEIDSLENYLAIQRLRLPKRQSITIQFETKGEHRNSLIEPLLLLPFVENAFKHGISYQQQSSLLIQLLIEDNILHFSVYNTKKTGHLYATVEDEDSGIGLKNIRRRLELLYPDRHELHIRNETHEFDVRLTVQL